MLVLRTRKSLKDVQDVQVCVLEASKIIKKRWKNVYFLKMWLFWFWSVLVLHFAVFWMHSEPLETSFGRFLGVQEALLGAIWAPMRLPRGSPEPPWGGIFLPKSSLIWHTPFWSSFWTLLGHFGVPFWLPKAPRSPQNDFVFVLICFLILRIILLLILILVLILVLVFV